VRGAEAGIDTARAYTNPEISFGSLGRQRAIQSGTLPGMLHGFTFSQSIELPGVRHARIAAAELGRESSQFGLAESRLAVRAAVKQAFFEALRRKQAVALAQDNLQLLRDLQRRIRIQVDVGEAARLELTRADAEVATAEIQARSADLEYSTALAALRATIGAPLGAIEPQDNLDPVAILPGLDVLREEVLARHPAVEQAETEARQAGAHLNLQSALKKPQPTVWADVLEQPDVSQYRWGVSLTLPLWNRRKGPIAEATAARQRALAMARLRRIEITASLERAYGQYQVAQQQVEMFEAGTLKEAEAAVRAAQAAFRFGERGIIEVLDAQRVLRGARFDYLNAQFYRQAALIELERLQAVNLGN
jgi:cobalt-zinc-cadmium efflux system outer membrane protein